MLDSEIVPVALKMFGDYPAMTMFRSGLAAEKAVAILDLTTKHLVDLSGANQRGECPGIRVPCRFTGSIGSQHLRSGSENRQVNVLGLVNAAEKECQVVSFRETGQLSGVVKP